jgi:3-methyl-2-oxobutanoate hydroxymethyltransferase
MMNLLRRFLRVCNIDKRPPHTTVSRRLLGSTAKSTSHNSLSLTAKRRRGEKITMVTAYDYPSAVHVARAGIDIVLVGDSVAMVEMGLQTTQPATMEQMLHHCQMVQRGLDFAANSFHTNSEVGGNKKSYSPTPMLVADMPFGSYEYEDTDYALRNAYRFVKEAGADAVKIEVSISSNDI